MPKLTAAQLDAQYGDELRQLYPAAPTARRLHNKLLERQPPLDIADGVLKTWIANYSKSAGSSGVSHPAAAPFEFYGAPAFSRLDDRRRLCDQRGRHVGVQRLWQHYHPRMRRVHGARTGTAKHT